MSRIGAAVWSALSNVLRRPGARPVVRVFSGLHVALYRRTQGRAQAPRYPTLLLTVTGRISGQPRTVPLVYIRDGVDFVVSAAYSGADRDPMWWLNLQVRPQAVVEERARRVRVAAELVTSDERDRLWRSLVEMYPPFAEYERRTTRQFPVIRLRPDGR